VVKIERSSTDWSSTRMIGSQAAKKMAAPARASRPRPERWETPASLDRKIRPTESGYVTSIAFSGDGALLATGETDRFTKLWRLRDRRLLNVLTEIGCHVAFVPGTNWLVAGLNPSEDGLRPATVQGTKQLQPLIKRSDLDSRGWLEGVPTFNFHPHLPHYAVTTTDASAIHLLAQQPIDLSRPHPFTEAGHREFNMFLWMPPKGERAGDILLADSTIFTTLFGGDESLDRFWKNIATK